MTPGAIKQAGARESAEFWMQMGKDLGEMKASLKDLSEAFQKFCGNEFHEVCRKQDEMEERLGEVLTKTKVIMAVAMVLWTIANVALKVVFKAI